MSAAACRRTAGLLVVLLVVTSMPVRVYALGACPVCGGWHLPILVADLGPVAEDPTPFDNPDDDPPPTHDDDRQLTGCHTPLPYAPTEAGPAGVEAVACGEVSTEAVPTSPAPPALSLIRPPRV